MITGNSKQIEISNTKKSSILPVVRTAAIVIAFAILSLFGASANAQSATASFTGVDINTQGNWQGKYGADGYSIANGAQSLPSYGTMTPESQSNWTWAAPTTDVRALETHSVRVATCWYSSSSYYLDINLQGSSVHEVALYMVDWDDQNRSEMVELTDANSGAVLDSRSISSFQNGMYLVWNISGHVHANITKNAGPNGVVSGVFFGGQAAAAAAPASASASFVSDDTTTMGNWQAKYGVDGYEIANGGQKSPSYASFSLNNEASWTWAVPTTDPRALQAPSGVTSAATWYNRPSFSFNVNIQDGKTHQMAVYALDWDVQGRSETIQIVNAASGAVLSTESISNFNNGIYLVWTISGNVQVNVTSTSGPNAVVSGVFFGTAVAASTQTPATTSTPAASSSAPAATTTTAASTPATTQLLSANATSLSFSSVTVSSSSAQTVTLTNTGSANVTISNVSVSGAGFNASGSLAGTTLTPGQTATLTATFDPAAAGNATGSITVTSNATNGPIAIALAGTAVAPVAHTVDLNWAATSGATGYNVYVSNVSGGPFTKLTTSPVSTPDYSQTGLETAQTLYYVVTSVNANGLESTYSNEVTAIVP